jgi:N-acetylglucosaminyl-diphospho-decaprenol L-rhamnosyltransferase
VTSPATDAAAIAAGTLAIVVHYGDPALTDTCLRSIAAGTVRPSLVAVVDNADVPLDAGIVEASGVPTRLLRPGSNLGFAAGVNHAFRSLPGYAWIWLVNNDAAVEPQAFDALCRAVEAFSGDALVSSVVMDETTGDVWFERACWYPWRLETKHLRVRSGQAALMVDRRRPTWGAVPYLPACSLVLPASIADGPALLDESFFVYGEDVELALRAFDRGVPLVVARRSIVRHRPSSASPAAVRERLTAEGLLRLLRRRFALLAPFALLSGTMLGIVRTLLDRDRSRIPARLAGYRSGLSDPGRGTSR